MTASGPTTGDTGPLVSYTDDDELAPRRSLLPWIVSGLAAVLVALLVLLAVLLLPKSKSQDAVPPSTAPTQQPAGPQPLPLPNGWTAVASDEQTDCAAHSYGKVQAYLATTPCLAVRRLLATTTTATTTSTTTGSGRSVVVASNAISFDSAATAAAYLKLVSADGTGNVSDLLREGKRIPDAITALPPTAAFASRQVGTAVIVAEAAYAAGTSPAGDAALEAVATTALGS